MARIIPKNPRCPSYPPPFMTQRNKRRAGWSPVAGSLGRPDLRRDAVEPSQCGENYQQPYLLRAAAFSPESPSMMRDVVVN
jgi:hypothetical protein